MPFFRASTRRKREQVAETALKLFAQHGYERVSVDDIVAATGTSKGTFYHYFASKEALLCELPRKQCETVKRWAESAESAEAEEATPFARAGSLLLALGQQVQATPLLVKSVFSLSKEVALLEKAQAEFADLLKGLLAKWLKDRQQAAFLYDLYMGTLWTWASDDRTDLETALRRNLNWAWRGLAEQDASGAPLQAPEFGWRKEQRTMQVAVIGGGLAGLTAAAYLSQSPEVKGVLFERSPQWGGRAFTYEKSGFTLNYGAHAIYGIDRHTIGQLEKELMLQIASREVNKRQVMYEKGEHVTPAPLDFVNLVKTDVIRTGQKVRFAAEIAAMIGGIHQFRNYETLGDYLAASNAGEELKELWEHLVCSNFFISPEDARKVPGPVIADYYHNLFLSQKPVNYILGSWAVITEQLKNKIASSGRWELAAHEGVDNIRYEDGKYWITTKNRESGFDRVVFAMPVQQVVKLLKGTPWEPFLLPYESNTATEVLVYDVGLSRVVNRPFSYISDMNHKLFITDVSATDHTLVTEGGQLLQGVAYLSDNTKDAATDRKTYLDERQRQMEALFDRHYPGWREATVVKRMSKRAMVQSVKNVAGNRMLPNRLESVPFYFCGDGCVGKGELAERAFSSARAVAKQLLRELPAPVGQH